MVDLYGQKLSRAGLAERTGAVQQVAGVELAELADGPERGVRVLSFRTGAGFSFQVANFYYEGHAFLSKSGMKAEQTAKYWWVDGRPSVEANRTTLKGPFDSDYVFEDNLGLPAWSKCGSSHQLLAKTAVRIDNNSSRSGDGYINTTTAGGSVKMVFRFGTRWKHC